MGVDVCVSVCSPDLARGGKQRSFERKGAMGADCNARPCANSEGEISLWATNYNFWGFGILPIRAPEGGTLRMYKRKSTQKEEGQKGRIDEKEEDKKNQ